MGRLDQSVQEWQDEPVFSRRGYLRYLKNYNQRGFRKQGRFRLEAMWKAAFLQLSPSLRVPVGMYPVSWNPGRHKPTKMRAD